MKIDTGADVTAVFRGISSPRPLVLFLLTSLRVKFAVSLLNTNITLLESAIFMLNTYLVVVVAVVVV